MQRLLPIGGFYDLCALDNNTWKEVRAIKCGDRLRTATGDAAVVVDVQKREGTFGGTLMEFDGIDPTAQCSSLVLPERTSVLTRRVIPADYFGDVTGPVAGERWIGGKEWVRCEDLNLTHFVCVPWAGRAIGSCCGALRTNPIIKLTGLRLAKIRDFRRCTRSLLTDPFCFPSLCQDNQVMAMSDDLGIWLPIKALDFSLEIPDRIEVAVNHQGSLIVEHFVVQAPVCPSRTQALEPND